MEIDRGRPFARHGRGDNGRISNPAAPCRLGALIRAAAQPSLPVAETGRTGTDNRWIRFTLSYPLKFMAKKRR